MGVVGEGLRPPMEEPEQPLEGSGGADTARSMGDTGPSHSAAGHWDCSAARCALCCWSDSCSSSCFLWPQSHSWARAVSSLSGSTPEPSPASGTRGQAAPVRTWLKERLRGRRKRWAPLGTRAGPRRPVSLRPRTFSAPGKLTECSAPLPGAPSQNIPLSDEKLTPQSVSGAPHGRLALFCPADTLSRHPRVSKGGGRRFQGSGNKGARL